MTRRAEGQARLALSAELARLEELVARVEELRRWKGALGRVGLVVEGNVTRQDKAPVFLFRLPGGAELHLAWVWSPAGSDGLEATLDVGTQAAPGLLFSGLDVRANAGAGAVVPRAARRHGFLGPDPVEVYGRYGESIESTAGGPWTVSVLYSVR